MVARYMMASLVLSLAANAHSVAGQAPKVLLDGWKQTLEANPKFFGVGVHSVEKPENAFIVTGQVSRKNLSLKTLDDREIAADIAELAAKKQLLDFLFQLDKGKLKLPRHLERFATESLMLDAHRRTLTMRGVQVAARWTDEKHVWCTLVIAQKNVERIKEFADSFRQAGAAHYLGQFARDGTDANLYRAFEIAGPDAAEAREALGRRFLAQGYRVAAFVVQSPRSRLPGPDDPLAAFLLKTKNAAWDESIGHFEAEKPSLEKALHGFLLSLETRYADPDALNYVGVCFKDMAYPKLASTFFEQALAQSPKQVHRYALTNLGLCLAELDQPDAARNCFQKAVEVFPAEPWSEKARQALRKLAAGINPN